MPEYIREKIHFARAYPLDTRLFAKEIISAAPQLQDNFSDVYQACFDQRTGV
ncbi:TetR family transcriptional regulator C-terminal domain-containing protein, partial [Neptunomonas phycophila]|uniref:TetR family transcriptional regulator C-terminal domain-containing protein n=1 Tax=Neptunomonas phycophila TaxID=1572645 RepID=UPI00349FBFB0